MLGCIFGVFSWFAFIGEGETFKVLRLVSSLFLCRCFPSSLLHVFSVIFLLYLSLLCFCVPLSFCTSKSSPFPLLSRTFGSPKCWCRCRSALRTSSMWCYATLTGLVRTFWAGCRSSRTADGATTVVTVSAGWGSSSSSSSSLILLSLVPVLEKKELFLIPLIPRVLLFLCVWWLVVVNDCRWRLISSVFSHLPGHRSVQSSGI